MIKYIHLYSTFLALLRYPKVLCKASHSPIYTPVFGCCKALPNFVKSNLGWSVLPKDTMTVLDGFELPTFQSLNNSLYNQSQGGHIYT